MICRQVKSLSVRKLKEGKRATGLHFFGPIFKVNLVKLLQYPYLRLCNVATNIYFIGCVCGRTFGADYGALSSLFRLSFLLFYYNHRKIDQITWLIYKTSSKLAPASCDLGF